MKKILIESCQFCPKGKRCSKAAYPIPSDCPLSDDLPESKECILDYVRKEKARLWEIIPSAEQLSESKNSSEFDVRIRDTGMFMAFEEIEDFIEAKEIPDNWIPVSERLPEEGERVLCYTEWGTQIGFLNVLGLWSIQNGACVSNISLWQPLPAPPTETPQGEKI